MMNRAVLLLLFSIVCEAQYQNNFPATFEGWLRWQEKKLSDIPKQHEISKLLFKLATLPEVTSYLTDAEAVIETVAQTSISKECKDAVKFAFENYKSEWTTNMLDAMAKPPTAVKQGAIHWVGGFQECIGNNRPVNWTGPGIAPRSHYCKQVYGAPYVNPLAPGQVSIDVGLCVPETCSGNDINIFTRTVIKEIEKLLNSTALDIPNYAVCNVRKNDLKFSSGAIAMIIICVLFGVAMLAGTLFDIAVYQPSKRPDKQMSIINSSRSPESGDRPPTNGDVSIPYESMREEDEEGQTPNPEIRTPPRPARLRGWEKALLAFSVYTNGAKILDTSQQPGRLNCLDGIRFLSMSWVILGHSYFFAAATTNNLAIFYPILNTWSYQAILNATFSVDSFFVLSGLLTGYIFLREASKMGTLKNVKFWVMYFVHRYWRLTPPYLLFLGFYTTLLNHMVNGPMWNQQAGGMDAPNCKANWWYNMLYINNFIGAAKMCMGWSWYLANDMQFHYLVAPIILPLIFFATRPPRSKGRISLAMVAVMAFILASVITLAAVSVSDSITVTLATNGFDEIYIKPWCRMAAYVVGLVTAYLTLEHQKGRFRLNGVIVVLGWLCATGICLATVYGLYGKNHGDYTISEGVSALYNAMSRLSWSVGLSWLIFACVCGYGGWINTFLSWKAFIPLSRLTYSAYLVHPVIMTIVYGGALQALMVSELSVVYFFFGHMVAAYLAAFVLSVTWESPLIGLERILLRK